MDDRVGASGAGGPSALVIVEVEELVILPVALTLSADTVIVIVEPMSD